MDNLWKPNQEDRSSLNRGIQKIRIHNLKADGLIEDALCPYCKTQVYAFIEPPDTWLCGIRKRYLTLNGSDHKCKDNRRRACIVVGAAQK